MRCLAAVALTAALLIGVVLPAGAPTTAPVVAAPDQVDATLTEGPAPLTEPDPSIDWASMKEGDTVPLEAFPAPVVMQPVAAQAKKKRANRVVIPKLKGVADIVSAPVVGGQVIVPSGHQVGWVTTSRRPGAKKGVTLLAGHRDIRYGTRTGPLWDAEKLRKGNVIKVVWKGKTRRYKVTKITRHPRHKLPAKLFRRDGKPMLALTTCTGPYELRNGSWHLSRNAVIWAKPVK